MDGCAPLAHLSCPPPHSWLAHPPSLLSPPCLHPSSPLSSLTLLHSHPIQTAHQHPCTALPCRLGWPALLTSPALPPLDPHARSCTGAHAAILLPSCSFLSCCSGCCWLLLTNMSSCKALANVPSLLLLSRTAPATPRGLQPTHACSSCLAHLPECCVGMLLLPCTWLLLIFVGARLLVHGCPFPPPRDACRPLRRLADHAMPSPLLDKAPAPLASVHCRALSSHNNPVYSTAAWGCLQQAAKQAAAAAHLRTTAPALSPALPPTLQGCWLLLLSCSLCTSVKMLFLAAVGNCHQEMQGCGGGSGSATARRCCRGQPGASALPVDLWPNRVN